MAKELAGVRAHHKKLHGKFNHGSKSNAATNPDRKVKGNTTGVGNTMRTKNTIKRLKMYDQRMPSKEQLHKRPTESARVDPNRKWFGNVRTIDQKSL
jgi:nuclear GTP-binding protein